MATMAVYGSRSISQTKIKPIKRLHIWLLEIERALRLKMQRMRLTIRVRFRNGFFISLIWPLLRISVCTVGYAKRLRCLQYGCVRRFQKWKMMRMCVQSYTRFRITPQTRKKYEYMHAPTTHNSQRRASGKVNKVSGFVFNVSLDSSECCARTKSTFVQQ